MTYSVSALAAVTLAVALDWWVFRVRLVGRRLFWATYAVVLGFQLVVDGVLTCGGIVGYDPRAIVGVRIGCEPVEDLLFGFALVTQTLDWWVWWGRNRRRAAARGGRLGRGPADRPGPGGRARRSRPAPPR